MLNHHVIHRLFTLTHAQSPRESSPVARHPQIQPHRRSAESQARPTAYPDPPSPAHPSTSHTARSAHAFPSPCRQSPAPCPAATHDRWSRPAATIARSASCRPFLLSVSPANLNIGHQAEHRAAPVSASPGMRVIQPLVALGGSPLCMSRTMSCQICSRLQFAGLNPRNRLNVSGQAFFHPVLIVGQGRERHVIQFMRHHPVVVQICLRRMLSDAEPRHPGPSRHVAPRRALHDARLDPAQARSAPAPAHWKAAVVRGDRRRRRLDVREDRVLATGPSGRRQNPPATSRRPISARAMPRSSRLCPGCAAASRGACTKPCSKASRCNKARRHIRPRL